MKKRNLLTYINLKYMVILLCSSMLLNVSCTEEEKPLDEAAIEILQKPPLLTYEEQTVELRFTSTLPWTASSNESWCSISPVSGKAGESVIIIHVSENPRKMQREAIILIDSQGFQKKVPVTQRRRVDSKVEVMNEPEVFSSEGGSQTLKISSVFPWKAVSDQPWCEVSPSEGQSGEIEVTVTVLPNELYDERTAKISFESEDFETDCTIYQKQMDALLLSSERAEMGVEGGNITIEVQSNIEFEHRISSDASEWIHPVSTKALSTTSLSFVVDANTEIVKREGTIVFISSLGEEIFTVYQGNVDPELVLTQSEVSLHFRSQRLAIELRSNTTFTLCPLSADWIRPVDEASPMQMTTYTRYFEVDENTQETDRETLIEFEYFTDAEKTQTARSSVKVIQQPRLDPDIIFENQLTPFSFEGGVQYLEIESLYDWTAESTQDWCRISSESGAFGKSSLEVNVDPNTTYDEREAQIVFKSEELTLTVDVLQEKENVMLASARVLEFDSAGGHYSFDYSSNVENLTCRFVSPWGDWLTWEPNLMMMADYRLSFHIALNNYGELRYGTIFLESDQFIDSIKVYQHYYKVQPLLSEPNLELTWESGVLPLAFSNTVTVELLSADASWLREVSDYAAVAGKASPSMRERSTPSTKGFKAKSSSSKVSAESPSFAAQMKYLEVDQNLTGMDREAKLEFACVTSSGETQNVTVTVKQLGTIYDFRFLLKFYYCRMTLPEFFFMEGLPYEAYFYNQGIKYPYQPGTVFVQERTKVQDLEFAVTNTPSFRLNNLNGIYLIDLSNKGSAFDE